VSKSPPIAKARRPEHLAGSLKEELHVVLKEQKLAVLAKKLAWCEESQGGFGIIPVRRKNVREK